MNKLLQVAIAVDQLGNALLGGWADETLSSRSYRSIPKAAWLIDKLFFWQDNHCMNAYISEREGRHLPPELRS